MIYDTSLDKLMERTHDINVKNGFWDEGKKRNVPTMIALMHAELSEALEADRKQRSINNEAIIKGLKIEDDEEFKAYVETHVKDTIENEMADAVIRIFDFCAGFDINLNAHINLKLRYNNMRERKHGKAY